MRIKRKFRSLFVVELIAIALLLSGCDSIGFGPKIAKCDDPDALKLTANLIRSNSGTRDALFGLPVNLIADHSLASTEMILNQGIDKEIGKSSCAASFVFTNPSKEPTTDTCKYVSRTEYELQYDTNGQLVSTIPKVGPLSCVKFTREEVATLIANPTDPARQGDLGFNYATGDGVPQDYAEAVKWFRKAADQGNAVAQSNLGVMYDNGQGVAQDYAEAVKWFRKAADQGNAKAQTNLGVMYDNGRGVPQDYAEAVKWYRKAADQGNAVAQTNLGVMYDNGRGVPQDYAEAVKWYRKAADQGDASAQTNLGFMYSKGQGVPQDYAEAVKWYRKAVDQGNASAQTNLGYMYSKGQGVPQDYAEAVKWYRKAADQGNANAQNSLGGMYSYGRGVPKNIETARMWWTKAEKADEASSTATYNLGESYYAGEEFGDTDNADRATTYWKKVINSTPSTDQNHKLASAGLQCIREGKSSKQCEPLRCFIEGRGDCPDL